MGELKSSIKFQLKKVLCMGVAIGNVGMEEKEIYVNTQARGLPLGIPLQQLLLHGAALSAAACRADCMKGRSCGSALSL